MKLIFQYFGRAIRLFPKLFAVSMGLIFLLTAMDTLVPWGLRRYLEKLTNQNDYFILLAGLILFAGYFLGKIFINIAWYVSLDHFGGKYIEALSLFLENAMAGTYYSEIEKIQPTVIRNVLFTDVLNVFRVVGHHVPSLLGALTVVLACVLISLFYDVKLTIFIFVAAGVGFWISWCSRKILSKTAGQTNARLKVHDGWCTQFVEMLPLVQSHNVLGYYQEHTSENLKSFIDAAIVEDKRTLFWTGLLQGYHSLFSIALSAFLAIPMAGNSVPDLVFFMMIADIVMQQAQKAETMIQQIMKLHVSFAHVEQLRDLPRKSGNTKVGGIETVDFHSVCFSYPGQVDVLRNFSCHIEKGDVVRLVGANGSGKSTFIKLLTRLYQKKSGEILLNGKPLEEYSQESLNGQILYINQDEKCLNETFRRYLELVTSHEIAEGQYQELREYVKLCEDGRVIEGNGASLSAGQRKKLLLMKFMLRAEEASVVILDELTAGLDAETTKFVYEFVKEVAAGKEKILILVDHGLGKAQMGMKTFVFGEQRFSQEL